MMYEPLFFCKSMFYSCRKKVHIVAYKIGGLTPTEFVDKKLHQMQKNTKERLETLFINGWAKGTKTHIKHKEIQIAYTIYDA